MSDLGLVFAEEEFDTDGGSPTVSDYTVIIDNYHSYNMCSGFYLAILSRGHWERTFESAKIDQ